MPELEDDLTDIIHKAARGRRQWMAKGNCINPLDEGERCGLNRHALEQIALEKYPLPQLTIPQVRRLELPFEAWTVNAWLVSTTESALLIDCGFEPAGEALLKQLDPIQPKAVLLTHDDRDHWGAATTLSERFAQARFLGPAKESPREFEEVEANTQLQIQDWSLRTLALPGHTPHGIGWQIEHPSLKTPLIACGDAIFAGSIGKIRGDYQEGLASIRENLLSLPESWVLLPGHGPMTTIGVEAKNNPFFA